MLKRPVLLASVAVLSLGTAGAAWSAAPVSLLPPDLDYATHCAAVETVPPPPLDRNWIEWQGEAVTTPADELLAIASEYLRGSERVEASPETGLRILTYLDQAGGISRPKLDRLLGRALIETGTDKETWEAGEARLLRALGTGETRAALDLAKLYGPDGPGVMRSPAKQRALAQTAAAAGDADGKLIYATILANDTAVSDEQKRYATEAALLAMIGEIGTGSCGYLAAIGNLYLQGDIVPADVPAAIAWLEQAAETGDARVQERLGDLLAGPRIEINDFERALDYSEAAAKQGRIRAAVTVGQAYATGLVRPRDLGQAQHSLEPAATAGSRDANLWLARIHTGAFGGPVDHIAATQFFRAAIGQGVLDVDLATEFGSFLIEASSGPEDLAEALELLTDAALAGSGTAAVKVAELLLDDARRDPALYSKVETFLRLGGELGRPEAARYLATLSLCSGPMFDPERAKAWLPRAMALGADSLVLGEGIKLLGSADAGVRAQGQALVRQAAMEGDARSIGYVLAQLGQPDGALGDDPGLASRLQSFVERSTDPALGAAVEIARIEYVLELDASPDTLAAAVSELDGLIAGGNLKAVMLKADLLKDKGATTAELLPLYQTAADGGLVKGMRELGLAMLDDAGSDVPTARKWLQQAADAGEVKAALRLVDTTAPGAMAALGTIGENGTVCSVDAMVSVARTYAATIDPAAPAEAAKWLMTALSIAGDDAADLVRVATAYRSGTAGAERVAEAEPLLSKAMELGSSDAAMALADGHLKGLWPDASIDTGHQLLAGLAAEGDGVAAARLLRAIAESDIDAPASEVVALVAQTTGQTEGRGETLTRLARLDEDGAFGRPDAVRRMGWLQDAADAGDTDAMLRLYRSYASGVGAEVAPDLALAWLQKAAEIGDSRAAKELAAAYTVGFGTAPDPQKAALWRQRADVVVN